MIRLRRRLRCLSALLLFTVIGFAREAGASIFAEVHNPTPYRNGSWSFGEIFTVGSEDIVVTALGAFDAGGNGFVTPGGIPTGLFRESDGALIASINIMTTDSLIGAYRYASIAPLTLLAGEQYRVTAVNRDDLYNLGASFTIDPAITHDGFGYSNSTALVSANTYIGDAQVWMANFQFDVANASMNPEPVSLLIWSILACVGFHACFPLRRRAVDE